MGKEQRDALDELPLRQSDGCDDVTGLGAPGSSFVTAFKRL